MFRMRLQFFSVSLCAFVLMTSACSPAFNWREVRPENSPLTVLLPCKPDKAEKTVTLGGTPTTLRMMGCETADVTFAVSMADIGNAAETQNVLAQWKSLTLANMNARVGTDSGASVSQSEALKVPGVAPGQIVVRVRANGQRADGRPVSGEAVYFSQGSQVFQAVIYAKRIDSDVADTFFASLAIN